MDVRPVTASRTGETAALMAEAFLDDPGFTHVVPDVGHRRAGLRTILTVALRDARAAGTAEVVENDGVVAGGAIWQPPGRYPLSVVRQIRATPAMVSLGVRIGADVARLARMGSAIDGRFPEDPVWYLQALAVDPARQGEGIGGALLRHGLARADRAGVDVYLETSKEANVAYYERFGFTDVDATDALFDGGPAMWFMRRAPA